MNPIPFLPGKKTVIYLPNGEQHQGQFAVVDLAHIKASHDEQTFADTPGYPRNPGGSNVNKRATKAQLVHAPTGLVVSSQVTRSAAQNATLARKVLADALDRRENGANSRFALRVAKLRKQKQRRERRAREKYGTSVR